MPQSLTITLGNLIYFEKTQLSRPLVNRLIRLAAFQNPEFYQEWVAALEYMVYIYRQIEELSWRH